jgi:farnesyl-diphosphate farnesyltransferase
VARVIIAGHPNTETARPARALVVTESSRTIRASDEDLAFQRGILPGVSRTFALTIPVLPDALAVVMTNAYLLCRIADTIEDDPGLRHEQKSQFHARFVAVVNGTQDAAQFARDLAPLLSDRVLPAEHDLVRNTAAVTRVTHCCSDEERAALTRCVAIMCRGMPEFQRNKSLRGLSNLDELAEYCYYVAGVVGEMCTELFCLHCPELGSKREHLLRLAVSFGQGLQMTNILKDIWDDRQSGACWLPRSVFANGTLDLERLEEWHTQPAFRDGLEQLLGVGHAHLRNALEYTCLIPKREAGIRRFCLWAIGLAVLTLRKIHRHPTFRSGSEVKVSRRTVKATVLTTNLTLMSNRALRLMFARAADGLPLATAALAGAPNRERPPHSGRVDVV